MRRLENLAVSAVVALAVSASVGMSATPPKPATHGIGTAVISDFKATSGPSLADRVAALTRRVDQLQNNDAVNRQNIRALATATNEALATAQDAIDQASCVTGGYQATWTQTGELVSNNDDPNPSNFILALVDPTCAS